jgi:2-(1,2-epoxy-1,2-dihydrophenyl)acetyl-CoA isomerase
MAGPRDDEGDGRVEEHPNERFDTLDLEVGEGVAHVTLQRPEVGNAINAEMARDLMNFALRCDEDPAVRAVVLSGSGRMFCSGGDLKSFAQYGEDLLRHIKETTTYLHAAVSRFARMDAPLIAAVHGAAAGAGLSLTLACDLVLADEDARFTLGYSKVGLTPDGSSTYFLPRLVGFRRAMELTLTGRVLSAQEAREWGIATRVVSEADLLSEAAELATKLAAGPTGALGASKRLLHAGWNESLETQMEAETRAITDIARTAEAREGVSAFVEKREPSFQDR